MPEGRCAQEARFVQRNNATYSRPSDPSASDSEDAGFLLFYAFDESQLDEECNCPETATSELWILDAGKRKLVFGDQDSRDCPDFSDSS